MVHLNCFQLIVVYIQHRLKNSDLLLDNKKKKDLKIY